MSSTRTFDAGSSALRSAGLSSGLTLAATVCALTTLGAAWVAVLAVLADTGCARAKPTEAIESESRSLFNMAYSSVSSRH